MRPLRVRLVRTVLVGVAVVATASALTGCAGSPNAAPGTTTAAPGSTTRAAPPTAPSTTKGGPPPTVYADDPARTVSATVGQTVALRVQTNPSTDSGWDIVRYDQDKLFAMGASYDDPRKVSTTAVPGRPVTQNLLFRATAAGTATVVLRYGQPNTPDPSDATVTFTIAVT